MSTKQDQRTVNFTKLWSGTSRFAQPKGSVPRGSNLIWLRRGAFRTTDGSLVVSSLNGAGQTTGQSPFRWIGRLAKTGQTPTLWGLRVNPLSIDLINITSGSYSTPTVTYNVTFSTPSFIQAQNELAVALGYDQVPQLFNGATSTAITNGWFGLAKIATWTASTIIALNTPIEPDVDNGHVYVAINNGTTGASEPSFPTGTGATVQDGSIVWQESGPSNPPAPKGALSLFYHGGYLFAWGTSATYQADGINGPDALLQSDLGNFNSWNPLNSTFVGKGDGTIPRGGGSFALSEAGIVTSNQLVLFKDVDTYILLGFFPNWTLVKTPNGVGCVASGSTQFIAGLGLIRMSYRGVAVFNGQDDDVDEYTDPIRSYLFGDDESGITPIDWSNIGLCMSAQFDNPKMYLLAVPLTGSGGALTRVFAYDVALKSWAPPIDLPWGIASLAYVPQNPLIERTYFGGFSDGAIQLFGNNCSSTWNGTLISWFLRTPEVGAPETPSYIRRLGVRGQPVYSSQPIITKATLNYQDRQGVVRSKPLPVPPAGSVLTASLDVDETVLSANIDISGQDRAIIEGLGYQYTPKPPSRIGGALASTQLSQVVTVIYQQAGSATVTASVESFTVSLPATAPNANYQLTITPNWNTTFWVSGKTIINFTVYFNTPSPADGSGSIDWEALILS